MTWSKLHTTPGKNRGNRQKEYGKATLDGLSTIIRLRRTHMPIKENKRYISLASLQNYESCYDVLHQHKL
ncbi:hypothetical protein [Paenibacillus sp. sgz500958]|uniref:hypothetical protein n=1 Tax=Paenibacillus sp. sgz500958 TaxID=3242475 RepID=UPI0036D3891E